MTITWARTWPDDPSARQDYVATDDGAPVGRIYLMRGGPPDGQWAWFANGINASPDRVGCNLNGMALSKQEAADQIKAVWMLWLQVRDH